MTVKELQDALKTLPADAKVKVKWSLGERPEPVIKSRLDGKVVLLIYGQ